MEVPGKSQIIPRRGIIASGCRAFSRGPLVAEEAHAVEGLNRCLEGMLKQYRRDHVEEISCGETSFLNINCGISREKTVLCPGMAMPFRSPPRVGICYP